jgi:hypothetical protein
VVVVNRAIGDGKEVAIVEVRNGKKTGSRSLKMGCCTLCVDNRRVAVLK